MNTARCAGCSLGEKQPEVHQIALAPALVALQFVEQCRRHFFPRAGQVVGDPHTPAGAAHQGRLDKVMAENFARQAAAAGQATERAVAHERRHPQNGVVPPIVRFAQLPEVQPGGEQRAVDAAGELLDARTKRVAAHGHRRGLDDAGARVRFHQLHQPSQAVPRHDAVSVENHHIAVGAAPATTPVGDVAGFAFDAVRAAAIEDAAKAFDFPGQIKPRLQLGHAQVGVIAVTEDVQVEMRARAGLRQ